MENDPLSLGSSAEGISYLKENPLYVANEWLGLVRSQGLLKQGKKLIDDKWEYEGELEENG